MWSMLLNSPHVEYAIDSTPDQPHHAVQWVTRACHGLVALSASDWPVYASLWVGAKVTL
jgi:hypothetical protein